jgi:DNA-binding transcriptional regulator YiaG
MITSAQVKAIRKTLGETQAAFARRFGVDQATIHRWETRGVRRGAAQKLMQQLLDRMDEAA